MLRLQIFIFSETFNFLSRYNEKHWVQIFSQNVMKNRNLSNRNHLIDLQSKSNNWFYLRKRDLAKFYLSYYKMAWKNFEPSFFTVEIISASLGLNMTNK